MEKCPSCKKNINSVKLLKCKICDIFFCSISCLAKHAQNHLTNNFPQKNILNILKRRQSQNITENYIFITSGEFREKPEYDEKYSKDNFSKVLINDFFPQELGSGSYGRVYLIKHNKTNEEYALKVIDKKKFKQMYGKVDIIKNEISIHSKLIHENIIRLYNAYKDENSINLIMEYAKSGNLFELLSKPENKKGLDEQRAFDYFIQVVNAVYFLHQNNIIHRDIKPENILIGKKGLLKLCDFGWAKELNLENRSTFCGTMEYMAPEIVGSENYDFSVDIWSLGILLYELIFGHSPFKAKNMKSVILNIKSHDLTYEKPISLECRNLIEKLLNINPQKRLKIKDILEHPFVKKYSKNYLLRKNAEFNYNSNGDNKYLDLINNKNIYNTSAKKEISKDTEKDEYDEYIKTRCNTKYIHSKTRSIFQISHFNNKNDILNEKNNNNKDNLKKNKSVYNIINDNIKKVRTTKDCCKTDKKLLYIEKFRDSLNSEILKMRKKIDSISFKNTECCTFEDVRDAQLSNEKQKNFNENGRGKIKKISLEGVFNKYKDNNVINTNIFNTERKIFIQNDNNDNDNNDNNDNKNDNNDNFNYNKDYGESDSSELLDEEEKKMIERLNNAYNKFEKKNRQ
jgi:serine/threonine protein kinase